MPWLSKSPLITPIPAKTPLFSTFPVIVAALDLAESPSINLDPFAISTLLAIDPVSFSVPSLTIVSPLYVFLPLKVSRPLPVFLMPICVTLGIFVGLF